MRPFFCVALLCAFLCVGMQSVKADILDDIVRKKTGTTEVQKPTQPHVAAFCKKDEKPEECAKRFSALFHKSLNKYRDIMSECTKRAGRMFPQDVVESLAKEPVVLESGQKISLWEALQVLGTENATRTTACLLALTHAIADDMARELGIPNIPETKYLEEFDKKEKEMRGKSS